MRRRKGKSFESARVSDEDRSSTRGRDRGLDPGDGLPWLKRFAYRGGRSEFACGKIRLGSKVFGTEERRRLVN